MRVSVVIPCYRSVGTLADLVMRLEHVLPRVTSDHEVILVVDGSPDCTWDLAADLARRNPKVSAIQLSRNYGQQNATVAGIRAARYEVVVTMDDDLQHLPEEVPNLIAALTDEHDLVYAVPYDEEHGYLRSLASRSVKAALAGPLGVRNARMISSFRIFRTFLRDGFDGITSTHVSVDVALSWATTRITSFKVRMAHREVGTSGYTIGGLIRHAGNMLLGYSTAPLRLASYLGGLVGLVGLVLLGRILWDYYFGATTVEGFTMIASMVALFSAAQLISIGVLGEYIGRIHAGGIGNPTYVIREDAPALPDDRAASADAELAHR